MTNLLGYAQITLGKTTTGYPPSSSLRLSLHSTRSTAPSEYTSVHLKERVTVDLDPAINEKKHMLEHILDECLKRGNGKRQRVKALKKQEESHRLASARAEKGEKRKSVWLFSIQHTHTHNYRAKSQPMQFVYGNYHPSAPFKI